MYITIANNTLAYMYQVSNSIFVEKVRYVCSYISRCLKTSFILYRRSWEKLINQR